MDMDTCLQSRNKTYVYLWTNRQFQQEQVEWDVVNKRLQHHGFKPVYFADPVENKNLSDLVLLDKRSAGEIRATLKTMLTDSERRQALIQELIKSNNQLNEEVQEHMRQAAQQSERATKLQALLERVKGRVQDIEDRYLGIAVKHHSHTQQIQKEKREAQKSCELVEQKLLRQREKTSQLQRKLYFTIKEEERRLSRKSEIFQHICKRVSKHNSAADQQVLDVIDFYETEMSHLLDEHRAVEGESERVFHQKQTTSSNITPSFKTILKAYQEQQEESRSQIEELKREVEHLKQHLETRLKEDNTTYIGEHTGDRARSANLSAHYHKLLTEIRAIVTNHCGPLRLHRQKSSSVNLEQTEFDNLLPTLEVWAQQLHLLKELQARLITLTTRQVPWQPFYVGNDSAEAVKVEDMMLLVDTMLESTSPDDKLLRSPTRHTLGAMVAHFQKLFDVACLSGVYPRMNEVYTRLEVMTNAMRNLREILDLDGTVSHAEVVNQVTRLVDSSQVSDFHNLLGDNDIDSIFVKVKQHDEFLPAFHALFKEVLEVLGVSHLDDILPALKSLKQTAQ